MFKFSLTNLSILLTMSIMTLSISSCKEGEKKAAEAPVEEKKGELAGMVKETIPGSVLQYARQMTPHGTIQIEGFVDGDKKVGQWIEYTQEGDIALVNNYVNGLLEGTAIRMTYRNQVDLRVNYKQGMMDGSWTAYKFGKVIEQRFYKADKLEGVAQTYDERTFKLKQEVVYKDGVLDGYFRYYDEEGNKTLEYQYKNGEKVSGGIIEPKK